VYQEFIRYLGDTDPTTRRVLERILEQEEDHAEELANFLTPMRDEEEGLAKKGTSPQKYQRTVA
jgi:bacterioferritin (cytochrome b1)